MDDNDLTELARGVVPFVHEAIAETLAKAPPLPPDLLEQIKAATEILQQPPPPPKNAVIVMPDIAGEIEKAIDKIRRPTHFDIMRNGQLAAFYSDGTSELLGPVVGPPGEKGERGADGIGLKGDEGPPGRDGAGVTAAAINRGNELMLTLSDGTVLTPGRVGPAKK